VAAAVHGSHDVQHDDRAAEGLDLPKIYLSNDTRHDEVFSMNDTC
jgi:hypothetical protein